MASREGRSARSSAAERARTIPSGLLSRTGRGKSPTAPPARPDPGLQLSAGERAVLESDGMEALREYREALANQGGTGTELFVTDTGEVFSRDDVLALTAAERAALKQGGPAALRQYRQQTADREFGILDGQEPGLADIERERTEATRTIRGFQDEAGIDRDQEPDLAGIETEREIDRVSAEVSKRNQRDAATLIEQAQEGTLSPEDVREYQAGLAREAKREAAQEAPTATDEHMAVANAARVRTRV